MREPTYVSFAYRCYVYFNEPQAYYWMRISYANHARLNRRKEG